MRVSTAESNPFHYCTAGDTNPALRGGHPTGSLEPIPLSQQFSGLDFGNFTRCPGGATQPISGSNPFLDGGNLNGKCRPRSARSVPGP